MCNLVLAGCFSLLLAMTGSRRVHSVAGLDMGREQFWGKRVVSLGKHKIIKECDMKFIILKNK